MAELEQREIRGWDVLRLSSPELSLDVVPALGGTIISLVRRADGAELLWTPPWALRARGSLRLPGTGEAQMLDDFPGGWQTLLPNGGESASAHGVEWGYDGEARATALDWSFTGSSLILTGRLARAPFEVSKIVSLQRNTVTVAETVHNAGREPVEAMWGSQLHLGGDLIGADTVVESGATIVRPDPQASRQASYDDVMPWPRTYLKDAVINLRTLPAADAEQTRLAYLTDFSTPTLQVNRPSKDLTVGLEWEAGIWPYVWYRMEAGGRRGYPWYSAGYFLCVTPCSSWPAHGLHEARLVSDSTIWFPTGATRTSSVSVVVNAPG